MLLLFLACYEVSEGIQQSHGNRRCQCVFYLLLHAGKQDGRFAHEPTLRQGVAAFVVVGGVPLVAEDMDMATRYLVEEAGFKCVAAAVVPHEESPSLVFPAELCEPPPPAHAVGAVTQEVSALGIGGFARSPPLEGLALIALLNKILGYEPQRLSACEAWQCVPARVFHLLGKASQFFG